MVPSGRPGENRSLVHSSECQGLRHRVSGVPEADEEVPDGTEACTPSLMSAPKPRFPRQCLSHSDGGLYCPDVRIYSGNPTWTDASRPPPIALPLYTHPHSLGLAAPHSPSRRCPSPTYRAAARPFLSESERSRMSSLLWRSRAHTATRSAFVIFFFTYKYQSEDIVTLTDNPEIPDEDREHLWPTRDNIISEMKNLVRDARPGDILVLLFSGHGGQVKALNDPNEKDGLDEILFAADSYRQPSNVDIPFANYVKDDEIKEIFTTLCAGCRCIMIFDCCHSGTAADLPDVTEDDVTHVLQAPAPSKSAGFAKMQTIHSTSAAASTGLSENSFELDGSDELALPSPVPELSSWSACKDAQNTIGNSRGGVFLRAFCQALQKNPRPTHAMLLQNLQKEIEAIMDSVPPERKEGLSDWPIPQLGSLRPHAVLGTPFIL